MDAEFIQPGDPEQLARACDAAERYYESSLNRSNEPMIFVYWDGKLERYRISMLRPKYESSDVEVVRIP